MRVFSEDSPVFLFTSHNGMYCEAINMGAKGLSVYKLSNKVINSKFDKLID